jgi:rhamnose utilization protein RhaD (predicted bifunctional aldolase and dehydrogenase)
MSYPDFSHLTPVATLDVLPSHDYKVPATTLTREVMEYMKNHPDVPGMMIMDGEAVIGAIGRQRFESHMQQVYSSEIYPKRPIQILVEVLKAEKLQLPATTRIMDAALAALQRPRALVFEPLVIEFPDGQLRLVDCLIVLLAQVTIAAKFLRQ